jgi:hypothetical protein
MFSVTETNYSRLDGTSTEKLPTGAEGVELDAGYFVRGLLF